MFDGDSRNVVIVLVSGQTWPADGERLRPFIEKMAEGSCGRCEADDIEAAVKRGDIQLWPIIDGTGDIICVGATEIVNYPRLRVVRCIHIVGKRPRRWMHLLAKVEEWARTEVGAARMEALHQPSHELMLCTGGWKSWHTLSEKVL